MTTNEHIDIKSHKEESYQSFDEEFLLAAIHYPTTPFELEVPANANPEISKPSTPPSASEPFETPILNTIHPSQTELTKTSPATTSPPPPLSPFPTSLRLPTTPTPKPSYTAPTVSALRRSTHLPPKVKHHSPAKRSLSKSPSPTKARKKRSVTFAREEEHFYFRQGEREGQEMGSGSGEVEVRGVRDIVRGWERGLMREGEEEVRMVAAV